MSVSGNYAGGVETIKPVLLTTTNITDIVLGVDRSTIIASWALANSDGSNVQVSCYFNDGTTDYLVYKTQVSAHSTDIVSEIPIRLREGQKFRAEAASSNKITVTPVIIRSHVNEPASGAGVNIRG